MQIARFDYTKYQDKLIPFLKELESVDETDGFALARLQKKYSVSNKIFTKTELYSAYKNLAGKHGLKPFNNNLAKKLILRPVRTQSGVAPITLLTKPYFCPGKCIYCPLVEGMPKSYLPDEPGAQRASFHKFNPYQQIQARLRALLNMGHEVEKAEIIILGGSWSAYPKKYQLYFIKEIFRGLNEFDFKKQDKEKSADEKQASSVKIKKISQTASWQELIRQQKLNEKAKVRCVGLVIETRPDLINKEEVIRLRKLGCTKLQIGVQSLDDKVLKLNKRGHGVNKTAKAFLLLRQAGFKIHAHWMANLYGSSVEKDKKDFAKLFSDKRFKPDELKIYPCSLLKGTELIKLYNQKKWQPYTEQELLEVVSSAIAQAPAYCRLTRVIRDIPSPNIVAGNKKTNFRQIAEDYLKKQKIEVEEIRAREIKKESFDQSKAKLSKISYETVQSKEIFLQYTVKSDKDKKQKLLGFLRLSLPTKNGFLSELKDSAIIREVHVYGVSLGIGKKNDKKAQHLGLGTKLIQEAIKISTAKKYKKISVISAIGTREYYRKLGFKDGEFYQFIPLLRPAVTNPS